MELVQQSGDFQDFLSEIDWGGFDAVVVKVVATQFYVDNSPSGAVGSDATFGSLAGSSIVEVFSVPHKAG